MVCLLEEIFCGRERWGGERGHGGRESVSNMGGCSGRLLYLFLKLYIYKKKFKKILE